MSKPCTHLDTIRDVTPSAPGCEECLKTGDWWVHLRVCRTCGHVGCCDQSPNQHATKHFHATSHPIIEGYVEHDLSVAELVAGGHDPELVQRVARMVDRNEYKPAKLSEAVEDGLGDWIVWVEDTDGDLWLCNANATGDVYANVFLEGDLLGGEGAQHHVVHRTRGLPHGEAQLVVQIVEFGGDPAPRHLGESVE